MSFHNGGGAQIHISFRCRKRKPHPASPILVLWNLCGFPVCPSAQDLAAIVVLVSKFVQNWIRRQGIYSNSIEATLGRPNLNLLEKVVGVYFPMPGNWDALGQTMRPSSSSLWPENSRVSPSSSVPIPSPRNLAPQPQPGAPPPQNPNHKNRSIAYP